MGSWKHVSWDQKLGLVDSLAPEARPKRLYLKAQSSEVL